MNGIDLDGLEFFSAVENNITVIGAKVQFENSSSANGKRVEAIKNEIQKTFNDVIQSANSLYKGQIIFDDKATLSISLSDLQTNNPVKGIGGLGMANIVNNNIVDNVKIDKSIENIAVNGVHELLHNGGLGHPTDVSRGSNGNFTYEGKIKDIELKPSWNTKSQSMEYTTTTNTNKNIYKNIMVYGKSVIDGKTVSDVRGGQSNATNLSRGQLNVVEKNIKNGLVNGEASLNQQ